MLKQSEAMMLLSDGRDRFQQRDEYRSYCVYSCEQTENVGESLLISFGDETLKGNSSVKLKQNEDVFVVVLPLIGTLSYDNHFGIRGIAEVGEIHGFFVRKGIEYEMINPFEDEWISYLQLVFKNDRDLFSRNVAVDFDISKGNRLIELVDQKKDSSFLRIHIGQFSSREEGIYKTGSKGNMILAFVVEGVFEVADRFLHRRDGVVLFDDKIAEFEALSNNAIILFIEVKPRF